MLFLLLLLHIEVATLEAANRQILRNGGNPCEGHVEVSYDGRWGYVGDKNWDENTEKVACRSTHCGDPVAKSAQDVWRPVDSTVWLNELKCSGSESSLWECDHPGWNISVYKMPTVKTITCSKKIEISLDEFPCAGSVRYAVNGEKHSGYFCGENWGASQAEDLCQSLKCGGLKAIPHPEWMKGSRDKGPKMRIDCSGISHVDNLWQCATGEGPCTYPAAVICKDHERLQLRGIPGDVCSGRLEEEKGKKWVAVKNNKTSRDARCRQMNCGASASATQGNKSQQLTCTDKVSVVLMDGVKVSTCYGAVYIIKNGSAPQAVCGSSWTKNEAEVVCNELKCGNAVNNRTIPAKTGIMDFVTCRGNEASLWHCQAKHGTDLRCEAAPYVICSESVKVKLVDGPGQCAGRLAVQYEGQFRRVNNKGWTDALSNTACRQLDCGNKRRNNHEKFSEGSGNFLNVECKSGAQNIAECITSTSGSPRGEGKAVEMICDEHKVVILNGSIPCAGAVKVIHGDHTYWLSGSKQTWNQASADRVCLQKECGKALGYDSKPNHDDVTDVWNTSLSCSSNEGNLFDCDKREPPSDHNDTIAYVTCSGVINASLTHECWGNVNFCVDGKCGGVCADTWLDQMSTALCQKLDCGDRILQAHRQKNKSEILFKSLHANPETTDLNQCNFVKAQDSDKTCNNNPAYVVCSGSVKAQFSTSRDKCSGNVEVDYEGQKLPVCMDALQHIDAQNAICRELECGEALGKTLEYFGPKPVGQVITSIACPSNSSKLKQCVVTSEKHTCTFGGLQCSGWRTMSLEVNKACSGKVIVHSEGGKRSVSSEGWTEAESERLCQDLKCGSFKSTNKSPPQVTEADLFWSRSFSCPENPENIWACETQTRPPQNKELFIECQDQSTVTLSQKCHGVLTINNTEVCASRWDDQYSHMVCQNQDCSNAIAGVWEGISPQSTLKYNYVRCDKHHYDLGQCERVEGKCDERLVSVYCTANVQFRTTGTCGGQVEVNYGKRWEKVCYNEELPAHMKDSLCHMINCTRHDETIKIPQNKSKVSLELSLNCSPMHMDIKHCVKLEPRKSSIPAEVFCMGYEFPPVPVTVNELPVVSIVVGVGFLLVLVILIVVFLRFCIFKKGKKSTRMLHRKEVEFESGDYEDVNNKPSEMEDFDRGRFRSEADFVMENDARSASSFSYDDIGEAAEAQPLTPPGPTAAASGDGCMPDGSVTYEVDDPQENYDDIDAGPLIMRTEAEVHDSPKTTPESDAAALPILVETDDNYLVPGQDE